MSVEVRIDPGRISRLLRLRGSRTERKLAERTARTAGFVEEEAPGSMGRHVTWKVEQGPGGLQGVITVDHPAVRYVLDGTRPHLIRPRRAKALRFEVGGRVTYAKIVRHPGTRANPFLQRALRRGR
ncbi:hypothetical protein [Streptomyces sp. DH12]|uniref:hypothetical protein n=1 Tax=Streptomyces sp. DH12 TaxID=2857010 RepID=UPI001E45C906|nr:hypothetical protein [Streptomyces sp. DH12]